MANPASRGLRSVAQSFAARVFLVAINAATGIVTARALRPEGRGELAAAILWPSLLASIVTLGLPSALIFNIRRDDREASRYLGAATLLGILVSILAMGIGYAGLPVWLNKYPADIVSWARLFLLVVPFTVFTLLGRGALEASGQFAASSTTWWAAQLPTLIALVLLAAAGGLTVFRAGVCYVLGGIPVSLWMLARVSRSLRPQFSKFGESARRLLSYGLRSYGVDLCGALAIYVDQALVIALLVPEAMGNYVVALSLSRLLNVLQQSVTMVLFPKAASLDTASAVELTGRAARVSSALTLAGGLCVILFGPLALRILYGPEYIGASNVLRVLVAEVVLSGCTFVLAQAFMALGRPGVVTMIQGAGLSLSVPLMLVLIPRWGTLGAAVSLLISTAARLVFTLISFPKCLGAPVPRIVIAWSEMKALAESAIGMLRIKPAVAGGIYAGD